MLCSDTPSSAWFAVLTKPRSEALASEHLGRQGFEVLDCRLKRSRPGARGLKQSIEPLFPRYLFVRSSADGLALGPIRSTRGVSQVLRFGNRTPVVPNAVIADLLARRDDEGFIKLNPPNLVPGNRVQVTAGPLCGYQGIFQTHLGAERVRLLIDLLGTPVPLVLPAAQLARTL